MAKRQDALRPRELLSDAELLELVQRQTFRYFWDGGHPVSGLAHDNIGVSSNRDDDIIATGGSGFGIMAIIVAAEHGWIEREEAVARLALMVNFLERVTCYHGHFPHFMNGRSGAIVPFSRKDDGGDIVETSLLFQGLCALANILIVTRLRRRACGRASPACGSTWNGTGTAERDAGC